YYQQLYFGTRGETLKTYYEKQSSGRYSIDSTVTDWVKVRYNEARYGRSSGYPCDDVVCDNVWELVRDGLNQWVADQQAAGRSSEEIAAELATFDVHDRYDHDGDGVFDEPDGYIDHLQIVHADGDMVDGDPWQGEDAIWSHRWYAYITDAGATGPDVNPLGATEVGDTGGPVITRSSPRTAACRRSPTSTATTSACPTTTTRPAARTAWSGGRSWPRAGCPARARRSAPGPATCRRGTSSSSGG